MIFFTDRDLGVTFPRILSEQGLHVERHDDHFIDYTSDRDWLLEVGRRGWFAISKDRRIRYRPNERDAVMQAGVGLFLLIGNAPHSVLADNFAATISKIERFVQKNNRPFIAKVYQQPPRPPGFKKQAGRVELWLSHEEWLKRREAEKPNRRS